MVHALERKDYNLAYFIAPCAVAWVTVFADYREKLKPVMPTVDQVSYRNEEFGDKISAAETAVIIEDMRQKLEDPEIKRQELQDKLNERDMVFIPAGGLRAGTEQSGREDESPRPDVQIEADLRRNHRCLRSNGLQAVAY